MGGQKGVAGEATGRDCIPSSRSSTGRGGGGAGPDTRVPAGPRSGLWVPEAASWNVSSSQDRPGPAQDSDCAYLECLAGQAPRWRMASVECEQGQRLTTPTQECGYPLPPPFSDPEVQGPRTILPQPRCPGSPGASSCRLGFLDSSCLLPQTHRF